MHERNEIPLHILKKMESISKTLDNSTLDEVISMLLNLLNDALIQLDEETRLNMIAEISNIIDYKFGSFEQFTKFNVSNKYIN